MNASGICQEKTMLSKEWRHGHLYRSNLGHGGHHRTVVAHRRGCLVLVASEHVMHGPVFGRLQPHEPHFRAGSAELMRSKLHNPVTASDPYTRLLPRHSQPPSQYSQTIA